MATIKISEMTDALILQDEDYIPILQANLNKKVTVELLRDYNKLHNKPTLNNITIENDKNIKDYNLVKENQGIKVNDDNQTLELETLGSIEIENRADVNKAITIKTADKTAKETAHQTMSKEYRPNDQARLSEGENQPVSYKAVKEYVDTLESKVDENERDIEAKHAALENKVDENESDIENKHTLLDNKVDENKRDIEDKVQQLDKKTSAKDSELEELINTNKEDTDAQITDLENKKLDKNQGAENIGKVMVVNEEGNLVPDKNIYTKEEVNYLLDDKMDKPYYDITISDDTTIENTLSGNFKIKSIDGNTYQSEESNIVPTPVRPIPIRSKKIKVGEEYVELRSLKETANLFDITLYGFEVGLLNDKGILQPSFTNYFASGYIPVKSSTQYNVGVIGIDGYTMTGTFFYDSDYNIISKTDLKPFETPSNAVYLKFSCTKNGGIIDEINSHAVVISGPSLPSSYVAPTVRDYKIVDHTTQTSKIVRNINQFELPTDFSWNDTDYYPSIFGNVLPEDKKGVYDTRVYNLINYTTEPYFGYSNISGLYLGFSECDTYWELNNSDEVNAFLTRAKEDGKPFIFQYQLATPVEETITYVETDTSEVGCSWQDTTSPSPDIPSDIKSVNSIEITVCGKNLFDINKVETFNQGVDYNIFNNGDGSITVNTSSTSSGVVSNKKLSELANLKNGETYTLTADTTGNEKKIYLYGANLMWDFSTSKIITQEMLDSKVTFYASGENTSAIISNIQIEQGSTATDYEPYTEQHVNITLPQPLYENDVANIESGEYEYYTKNTTIDFNRFDGNLDLIQDNTVRYYFHKSVAQELDGIILDTLLFDCFTNVDDDSDTIHFKIGGSNNEYIFMYIPRGHTDDVAYAKEYLSSLNPIANFAVETKTTQPIPEEDLAKLKSLKTAQSVTNIFVGGEVKPILNAQYPKDIAAAQAQLEQKVLLMSETLKNTQANLLLQGGND